MSSPETMKPPTPLLRNPAVLRILVPALLAEIGFAVLNISTMPVYLREDRHFGEAAVGDIIVAFLLSEAIFKAVMGHLADKHGRKLFMTLGPALSVATAFLSIHVPHLGGTLLEVFAFVGLRLVDGLGAAMLWPAAFAAMSDSVEDEERQQAMSLLNLCYMLGVALALPIGGIVDDYWRTPVSGLYLAMGLFGAVALSAGLLAPKDQVKKGAQIEGEISFRQFFATAKTIPSFLILAMVTFAGIGFPMPIIKFFALDQFGMSESAFGGLVFPAAISLGLMSVPLAKLGERIGRTQAVHLGLGLCALGLGMIAAGAFSQVVPVLGEPWMFALGGLPVGIGFLLAIPAWYASVSDINPDGRAANIGAVMTAQGLGAIVGAFLGGRFYQRLQPLGIKLGLGEAFGHYSPFLACFACMLVGWMLSMQILKPQSAPAPGR
jgi:MFS transporter, DHA1 family, multidrug resistance protein